MLNLKKLSIVSAGTLIATLGIFGNNSVLAASMKDEYITVNQDVVIDFDENVGVSLEAEDNPLNGGQKLDNLWADYGLEMDSDINELWLFDSNCKPKNGSSQNGFTNTCTGNDPDLATGQGTNNNVAYNTEEQGNVLIIQENNGQPDDYANLQNPGTISFIFTDEEGVDFNNIGLLDFDDPGEAIFNFTFINGDTQEFIFESDDDENVTLLSEDGEGNPLTGDNSLRIYDFDFSQNITKLDLTLAGSGAVSHLDYERNLKKKVPESGSILGLVFGTVAVAGIKRKRSLNKLFNK